MSTIHMFTVKIPDIVLTMEVVDAAVPPVQATGADAAPSKVDETCAMLVIGDGPGGYSAAFGPRRCCRLSRQPTRQRHWPHTESDSARTR